MAKRNHNSAFKPSTCSVCSAQAITTSGKRHRRCTGQKHDVPEGASVPIRPKHDLIPSANRGTWQ